ncbi:MAG: NAD(P)/FAD-dependent oxidoreductase [Sneathiellaceae bacterium]
MTAIDIVVVGAGAAGIAAARRLAEHGLSCVLVEAGDKVGGRARTEATRFAVPVDLGCHWLHAPAQNPLKGHADRLRHRYRAAGQIVRHAAHGRWLDAREGAACTEHVAACHDRIRATGRAGEDRAVAGLFDDAPEAPWHDAFAAQFTAKWGVPPDRASTLDVARYAEAGDDLPVTDGLGALVSRLARCLPVRLGAAVSRIALVAPDAVRVDTAIGRLEGRAAIVTVSTGVLQSGAIRFTPELPDWKRAAIGALPMGHCNKLVLAFDRRAMDVPDHCLVVPAGDGAGAVELLLRPCGAELAVALYNGPHGRDLAAAGAAAMEEDCLQRLSDLFGTALRRALRPGAVMADWDGDPLVRGYVAAALPGRSDARRDLARPVDGLLFFAGEAVSLPHMGDAHGAWLSGIAAADAAATAVLRRSGRADPGPGGRID